MLSLIKQEDFTTDILYYAEDGRLTGDPDGIRYNWCEFIKKFKDIGRPLTEEEAQEFRIR